MNDLDQYISNLKNKYEYFVIPSDQVETELDKLNDLDLPPEQETDRLYWSYKIQQTSLPDWEQHNILSELIDKAEELDQQIYVLFGKLARLFFSRSLAYISAMISTIRYLDDIAYSSLVFDQLTDHINKISAFHIAELKDHPAGDTLLPSVLEYLVSADDIVAEIDSHTLLQIHEFEERLTGSTSVLDGYIARFTSQLKEQDRSVPEYFTNRYALSP